MYWVYIYIYTNMCIGAIYQSIHSSIYLSIYSSSIFLPFSLNVSTYINIYCLYSIFTYFNKSCMGRRTRRILSKALQTFTWPGT